MFACDIVHHSFLAVLFMLYKIMCNLMHLFYSALYLGSMWQCGLPAVLRSHIGTLMGHVAAEPDISAGFIPLAVSLWKEFRDPVFDGVRLAGFKYNADTFLLALLLAPF